MIVWGEKKQLINIIRTLLFLKSKMQGKNAQILIEVKGMQVYSSFFLLWWNMNKAVWGENGYLADTPSSQSITESSQGMNSSRNWSRNHREKLLTGSLSGLFFVCFLIQAQATCLVRVPPTVGLAILPQLSIKTMLQRLDWSK